MKRKKIDRRQFLRIGTMGIGAGALATMNPLHAYQGTFTPHEEDSVPIDDVPLPQKKVIFIFLEGGNDGTNTVPPEGDATYYAQRTTPVDISIPVGTGISMGAGLVCRLHPSMSALTPMLNNDLAVIQRVGYYQSSRSHFDAQQHWKTAKPVNPITEGFGARYLNEIAALTDPLPGATFYRAPHQILATDTRAFPQIENVVTYEYDNQAILGTLPSNPDPNGSGLLGVFSGAPNTLVRRDGLVLLQSMDIIQNALPAVYPPANLSSLFPSGTFARNCMDAAWAMVNTNANAAVVADGGYDLHQNQGGATGVHANKLDTLAQIIRGIRDYATNNAKWNDLLVVVMTEFGRTDVNASGGTDHGKAGVMFVAGGTVVGDAYNCDNATYFNGGASPLESDGAMDHRTDFRTVLAEVFDRHLGMSVNQLDTIIPGWSGLSPSPGHPDELTYLGIL